MSDTPLYNQSDDEQNGNKDSNRTVNEKDQGSTSEDMVGYSVYHTV